MVINRIQEAWSGSSRLVNCLSSMMDFFYRTNSNFPFKLYGTRVHIQALLEILLNRSTLFGVHEVSPSK